MNEGSKGSVTPMAGRRRPRGWLRIAFPGSILFLLTCWVSALCFSQTGTKALTDPYSRGVLLLTQQKWKEAAAEFQEAVRTNPHNSQAYAGLGVALTRSGNAKDAEAAFEHAIQLDAKNAQAHYYLGLN